MKIAIKVGGITFPVHTSIDDTIHAIIEAGVRKSTPAEIILRAPDGVACVIGGLTLTYIARMRVNVIQPKRQP